MSKSVERRLALQKKSKLEELGGLDAAKKWRDGLGKLTEESVFADVLIEHIESLAAERDQLKKRVEELDNSVTVRDTHIGTLKTGIGVYAEKQSELEAKLQAARELADAVKLWHNRQVMHSFDLKDCNHLVCVEARDFLKMLEEK